MRRHHAAVSEPGIDCLNRQQAANREPGAHLLERQGDERQVHDRQPDGDRHTRDFRKQHADAGDAAVDEIARQQEALQAHSRRQDAEGDEQVEEEEGAIA